VLDVKCLSFNIEPQHIGMSSIKNEHSVLPQRHTYQRVTSLLPSFDTGSQLSVKIKNTCFSKPRKNKILIVGDSHARGCVADFLPSLNESFEVMGTVMPGSRLEHITSLNHREIVICTVMTLWLPGEVQMTLAEMSHTGLRYVRKFALQNKHTNIIAITPSHRYDRPDFSCVNKETQVFNRRHESDQGQIYTAWTSYELFRQRKDSQDHRANYNNSFDRWVSSYQFKTRGSPFSCSHC